MATTQNEIKVKKGKSNIFKITLGVVLALILATIAGVWYLFGSSVSTILSIERVGETQMFTMEYKGDYGFDDFLEIGASNDGEVVDFVVNQILKGIPLNFELPDLGCSTFVATTPEGDSLFGRNFDMYYSPVMLVETEPDNGYKSISMVNLAYIGYGEEKLPTSFTNSILTLAAPYAPIDGMNEMGLAVGVLLIDTDPTVQDTDKIDITTTTAIRLLLDKAATVDEAIELLSNYDMRSSANSCYHFHIADASGKSVVVEYINDEMIIVDDIAATNFLLTPGDYDFGRGQDRYETLISTLEENSGILTSAQAMDLLGDVKQLPTPEKESSTQWSCVYNQTQKTVEIAVAMDFENIYSYSLN